jgi:histidyl-tRNA synthetase
LEAVKLTNALRRAGLVAEIFASGSPRKRYERALKSSPAAAISLDVRDGQPHHSVRLLDGDRVDAGKVHKVFGSYNLAPTAQ